MFKRLLVLPLLLLWVAGCGTPTTDPTGTAPGGPVTKPAAAEPWPDGSGSLLFDAATQAVDGLTITLRLPKLRPSEAYSMPIDVDVLVKNDGTEPVRWRGPSAPSACDDAVILTAVTADGQIGRFNLLREPSRFSSPLVCTEDLAPHELLPGGSRGEHYRWTGALASAYVKDGPVEIVASYPVGHEFDSANRVEVRTAIEVVGPSPFVAEFLDRGGTRVQMRILSARQDDKLALPVDVEVLVSDPVSPYDVGRFTSEACNNVTGVTAHLADGRKIPFSVIRGDGSSAPLACTHPATPEDPPTWLAGTVLARRFRWDGLIDGRPVTEPLALHATWGGDRPGSPRAVFEAHP